MILMKDKVTRTFFFGIRATRLPVSPTISHATEWWVLRTKIVRFLTEMNQAKQIKDSRNEPKNKNLVRPGTKSPR